MSDGKPKSSDKDPAVIAAKVLKTHITICLIQALRDNGRSNSINARKLKIPTATFKKLMEGDYSAFCLEDLLELVVRAGFTVESVPKKLKPRAGSKLLKRLGGQVQIPVALTVKITPGAS